jgi:hypothetical protein
MVKPTWAKTRKRSLLREGRLALDECSVGGGETSEYRPNGFRILKGSAFGPVSLPRRVMSDQATDPSARFFAKGVPDRLRLAGSLLIALGMVVLLTPVGAALSQVTGADSSTTPQPHMVPGSQAPGPPGPTLSSDQRDQALQVLASDDRAQQILQGKDYTVAQIEPWGGDGDTPIIGAAMTLHLAEPASYPMQSWPLIQYRPGLNPPYTENSYHLAAVNVTEFLVNVDFQRGLVVNIEPYGDNVQITPGVDVLRAEKRAKGSGE